MYHTVHITYNGQSRGWMVYCNNKPVTRRDHLLSRSKARAIVQFLNGV